jgi:hypothetical protein
MSIERRSNSGKSIRKNGTFPQCKIVAPDNFRFKGKPVQFFHITNAYNLDSIFTEGLLPQKSTWREEPREWSGASEEEWEAIEELTNPEAIYTTTLPDLRKHLGYIARWEWRPDLVVIGIADTDGTLPSVETLPNPDIRGEDHIFRYRISPKHLCIIPMEAIPP